MPTSLDPLSTDPYWQDYYNLGRELLQEWSPEQEAARKERAFGSLTQTLGQRYARAGYTGSSPELDALQRASSQFELDWAERRPQQIAYALSAGNLPVSNLEQMINREAQFGGTYRGAPTEAARRFNIEQARVQEELDRLQRAGDVQLAQKVLASLGLPQWLAKELFGISPPGTQTNPNAPVYSATYGLFPRGLEWLKDQLGLLSGPGSSVWPTWSSLGWEAPALGPLSEIDFLGLF